MNKTIWGVIIGLLILIGGWYFLSPNTFPIPSGNEAVQPPALPE
jgi:hypothetical protein